MINLDPRTTALILIDLQKGIIGRELAPYTGADVVKTSSELAERFRREGAPVILVNVDFAKDFSNALNQPVDSPNPKPAGGFPEGWSELVDGLAKPGDIRITKYQWGAFYGTDMDVQLRRRGIKTVVVCGVATNMGVESTVRQAWEHGYEVVIAEDATTSRTAEMHNFAVTTIFPLISRVTNAANITFSLLV